MNTPITTTYTRIVAQRRYEISNHLGNVLATVLDRKTTTATTGTVIDATTTNLFRADIATATDYYAFGQPMPTRQYTATFGGGAYRYGFNGKENDNSFDSKTIQDYGFRLYSPALCKFLSVDPLSPKYPELTPYQFASNTPIMAIDLDGLESFVISDQPAQRITPVAQAPNAPAIQNLSSVSLQRISGPFTVTDMRNTPPTVTSRFPERDMDVALGRTVLTGRGLEILGNPVNGTPQENALYGYDTAGNPNQGIVNRPLTEEQFGGKIAPMSWVFNPSANIMNTFPQRITTQRAGAIPNPNPNSATQTIVIPHPLANIVSTNFVVTITLNNNPNNAVVNNTFNVIANGVTVANAAIPGVAIPFIIPVSANPAQTITIQINGNPANATSPTPVNDSYDFNCTIQNNTNTP